MPRGVKGSGSNQKKLQQAMQKALDQHPPLRPKSAHMDRVRREMQLDGRPRLNGTDKSAQLPDTTKQAYDRKNGYVGLKNPLVRRTTYPDGKIIEIYSDGTLVERFPVEPTASG